MSISGTMKAFQMTPEYPEGKVVDVPIPTPQPGEALIRVLRAGICNTDLELIKGYMGFQGTLGHEFVGRVESFHADVSMDVQKQLLHQRVCGDINLACGDCKICDLKNDRARNHCPNRTVLGILKKDGTMAEYLTLPVVNLHVLRDDMTNATAAFSEPLAAACRIVEQGLVESPESKIAIMGDGKLGLMIAEVMGRQKGLVEKPLLVGKHQNKLDFVANSGVQCKLVKDVTGDDDAVKPDYMHGFDVVIDATGNPKGLSMATCLCRPLGTLVLKSTCAGTDTFHAAPIVIDEIKIVGSRCGPFPPALDLLAIPSSDPASLNVEKYITKTFPLEQAAEAMAFAAEKSTMKVQLICTPDS